MELCRTHEWVLNACVFVRRVSHKKCARQYRTCCDIGSFTIEVWRFKQRGGEVVAWSYMWKTMYQWWWQVLYIVSLGINFLRIFIILFLFALICFLWLLVFVVLAIFKAALFVRKTRIHIMSFSRFKPVEVITERFDTFMVGGWSTFKLIFEVFLSREFFEFLASVSRGLFLVTKFLGHEISTGRCHHSMLWHAYGLCLINF